MTKTFSMLFSFLFVIQISLTQDLGQLEAQRKSSWGFERYSVNKSLLLNSSKKELLLEVVDDSTNLSQGLKTEEDLLNTFNTMLTHELESDVRDRVLLCKARIVSRSINKEDGYDLFVELIAQKKKEALLFYSQAMIDNKDIHKCAILCYDRKPEYQFYRKGREDLSLFSTLLLMFRAQQSGQSAVELIGNNLSDYSKDPNWKKAAQALCLALDGKIGESEEILQNLQSEESAEVRDGETTIRTADDAPLYLGWVYMLEGKDMDKAISQFDEYAKKNEDKKYVFDHLLRVCRDVHEYMNKENLLPLTSFIESNLLTIPNLKESLPIHEIPGVAHFEDLHAQAYQFRGDVDNAIIKYEEVYNKYFPTTVPTLKRKNALRCFKQRS